MTSIPNLTALALSLHDPVTILAEPGWEMAEISFLRSPEGLWLAHIASMAAKGIHPGPKLGDPSGATVDVSDTATEIELRTAQAGIRWTSRALRLSRNSDGLQLTLHGGRGEKAVHVVHVPQADRHKHCIFTEDRIAELAAVELEADRRAVALDEYLGPHEDFFVDLGEGVFTVHGSGPTRRFRISFVGFYSEAELRLTWGHVVDLPCHVIEPITAWSETKPTLLAKPSFICRPSVAHRLALSAGVYLDPNGFGVFRAEHDEGVHYLAIGERIETREEN